MIYEVSIGKRAHRVELTRKETGWDCKLDGRPIPLDVAETQDGVLSILMDGQSYQVKQETSGGETKIVVGHQRFPAAVRDPRSLRSRLNSDSARQGVKKISAPMPGKVVRIVAPTGSEVEIGHAILVIEAMKMQNELKSPKKGIVKRLNVTEGAAVEAGQVLAEVE
ncbi:MAG TPA: biotin/lipoyl-containing protein [Terriglobales bacterium]|jgi:biotin carboxyl carrier protein|nr:biotin/lipoyl-containing protein [Terriglobales bacterium]